MFRISETTNRLNVEFAVLAAEFGRAGPPFLGVLTVRGAWSQPSGMYIHTLPRAATWWTAARNCYVCVEGLSSDPGDNMDGINPHPYLSRYLSCVVQTPELSWRIGGATGSLSPAMHRQDYRTRDPFKPINHLDYEDKYTNTPESRLPLRPFR
jgi:hypothetical protein